MQAGRSGTGLLLCHGERHCAAELRQKKQFGWRRYDYNSQEALWPSQAIMFKCLSSKLPPLPLPPKLGGQFRSLKGVGEKKKVRNNVISTPPPPFPFGILVLQEKTIPIPFLCMCVA